VHYEESHPPLLGLSDYTSGRPDLEGVSSELDRGDRMLKAGGFNIVRDQDPNTDQLEQAFKGFNGTNP
jgi:hypothetical protein